ncbi:MAG: GAF domain-containing protein, partial [Pseudomonadales bacterium]
MNNPLQATAEAHFPPAAADDDAREDIFDARVDANDCAKGTFTRDTKQYGAPHAGEEKNTQTLNKEVAKTWLDWQCKMIAGVISGNLYLPAEDGATIGLVSSWPTDTDGELSLAAIAQRVAKSRHSEVIPRHKYGPGNQRVCDLIASPLVSDGKVLAIVCCGVSTRSEAQQQAILKLLQWGCLWLDTLLHQQSIAAREYGTFVNHMLAAAMTHQSSHAASIEITNQLAEHFGCERVSLGYSDAMQIRLRAISHLSDYDPRTEMARQIEAAMEEAVNQNQLIAVPTVGAAPKSQDMISRSAHDNLAKCQKHQTICSVPLHNGLQGDLQTIGAITFERADRLGFTRDELAHFTLIASVVGPMLALKYREERSLPAMLAESCRKKLAALIGPENIKLKLGAAFALCTLFLLSVVEGNYRITAPASIEAESRQVIVAPIDGYIHRVERRAGDLVKEGELIAALKDDTL